MDLLESAMLSSTSPLEAASSDLFPSATSSSNSLGLPLEESSSDLAQGESVPLLLPLAETTEADAILGLDADIPLEEGGTDPPDHQTTGADSGVDPLTGMTEAQAGIVTPDDDRTVFDYTTFDYTADGATTPSTESLLADSAETESVTEIVEVLDGALAKTLDTLNPETLTADAVADVVADVVAAAVASDASPEVVEAVTQELIRRGLVFIDSRVTDYESLLAGVEEGYDAYVIGANNDGVEEITTVLSGYTNIDSLHIVTDGDVGNFWLGNAFLDSNNLDGYEEDLRNWAFYLSPDADILLYSCNLAANDTGQAFVDRLRDLTGADVAASSDRTGLSGNWVFEYKRGDVTTGSAFTQAAMDGYSDSLAVLTVTTATDAVAADGFVSLREAVQAANTNTAVNEASAGDAGMLDEIRFATGLNTVNVTAGEISITGGGDLLITGQGTLRTIDAGSLSRIFNITSPDVVTLDYLRLTNGNSTTGGAVLYSGSGVLNIENSTFSNNVASGNGGAIAQTSGVLNVHNSTFTNNIATSSGDGGAIYNTGTTVTNITNSTFNGNQAANQGGAIANSGTTNLTNSTLSGNKAAVHGGGIANLGTGSLTVTHATIVANTADSDSNNTGNGGGIYNAGTATATVNNSILARNYDFVGTQHRNVSGAFTSNGGNLIGSTTGSTGFGGTDIIIATYDSNLFTTVLQNSLTTNGGFTANYALRPGSPAIDKGVMTPTLIDQRGALRDASPDIGAYEASSTYVVTNTRDDRSIGSLRSAILFANANINPATGIAADTIQFDIPVTDPGNVGGAGGYWSIAPSSALPNINQQVTIDGFSQPGSGPSSSGHNIEINGLNAGATTTGLIFTAGAAGSTVQGLTLNRFGLDGIFLNGGSGYTISDNRFGTDVTGALALGNGRNGLTVAANNSQITHNIASGNGKEGISVTGSNNTIGANRLGVDANGAVAIGNGEEGLALSGTASGNLVSNNLMSGNGLNGLHIEGSTNNNTISNNRIGTDITGAGALGNTANGILIGGNSNLIENNLISGNHQNGVRLAGTGAFNNVFLGNYIGVNTLGSGALGNRIHGIRIDGGANNNEIGDSNGIDFSDRNVISGNGIPDSGSNGIFITGATSSNNVICWNYIGTDVSGTADLTAYGSGVAIIQAANNQVLNNLISGNQSAGVWISGGNSSGNTVDENRIGTNFDGSAALTSVGRQYIGVHLLLGANGNFITNNQISGNTHGIILRDSGTNNNVIQNNYIGTNATGTAAIPNQGYGVGLYSGASNNDIDGNLISGNSLNGVYISDINTTNNEVINNYIGTNLAGNGAIPNGGSGVRIQGAPGNDIRNNLISGNAQFGVWIWGSTAQGNEVLGNYIGTNAAGTAAIGNAQGGVWISDGADNNLIGNGAVPGRNLISGNNGSGVVLTGTGTSGNQVNGNYIGTNVNGTAALPNSQSGVELRNGVTNSQILGNLISGNLARGIVISSTATGITHSNTVAQNYVGTDSSGIAAIPNGQDGLLISNAHSNTIGGSSGNRNLFSGNAGYGVRIIGTGSTGNQVTFNTIGRAANDTTYLSNGLDSDPLLLNGVKLGTGVTGNTINSNIF